MACPLRVRNGRAAPDSVGPLSAISRREAHNAQAPCRLHPLTIAFVHRYLATGYNKHPHSSSRASTLSMLKPSGERRNVRYGSLADVAADAKIPIVLDGFEIRLRDESFFSRPPSLRNCYGLPQRAIEDPPSGYLYDVKNGRLIEVPEATRNGQPA